MVTPRDQGACAPGNHRDRGAVSLEWSGLLLVAALVVGLVFASISTPQVGQAIGAAVCRIFTLGQGDCSGPQIDALDPRIPSQPCTTNGEGFGYDGQLATVDAAGGRRQAFQVETLSNGQYRVNLGGGSGAEQGGGWDARISMSGASRGASDGRTSGDDSGAGIQAMLDATRVETYVVNTPEEVERLREYAVFEGVVDTVTAAEQPRTLSTAMSELVVDPLVRWAGHGAGVPEPPQPSSVTYVGGGSAEASTYVTPFGPGADGTVGGQPALGYSLNADGTVTRHAEVADLSALPGSIGNVSGSSSSQGPLQSAATYADGELTSVSVTSTVPGSSERTTRSWTLPVTNAAELELATTLLHDPGASSWQPFVEQVDRRGQSTRVVYDTTQSSHSDAAAGLWFVTGGGANLGLGLTDESVSSAQYWDGQGWTTWDTCLG